MPFNVKKKCRTCGASFYINSRPDSIRHCMKCLFSKEQELRGFEPSAVVVDGLDGQYNIDLNEILTPGTEVISKDDQSLKLCRDLTDAEHVKCYADDECIESIRAQCKNIETSNTLPGKEGIEGALLSLMLLVYAEGFKRGSHEQMQADKDHINAQQ